MSDFFSILMFRINFKHHSNTKVFHFRPRQQVIKYPNCFISFQTEHVVHVLYAQDRQKVDEIRRGRAFAHIALIVMLACVLDTVLGFIINVKILLPIATDMLKNRHFSYIDMCINAFQRPTKVFLRYLCFTFVVRRLQRNKCAKRLVISFVTSTNYYV